MDETSKHQSSTYQSSTQQSSTHQSSKDSGRDRGAGDGSAAAASPVSASAVLQHLQHPVLVLGPDGAISLANQAFAHLVGLTGPSAGLVGSDPLDLLHPSYRDRAAGFLELLRAGAADRVTLRVAGESDRRVIVRGALGPSGEMVLELTDLAGTTLDQGRLRSSERRFRAAFEAAAHGLALVGRRGHIMTVNRALADLLGRSREDLVGRHVAELLDPPNPPASDWSQQGVLARRLRHADGGLVHVVVTVTAVEGDEGDLLSLVQVQDVTERRRSEQQLRHLALHDQLTDLPSRHLLLERLHSALEQRSAGAPLVAALFVDLDEFKLINDGLGHAVGDLVLRETALRLQAVTRPQDTVARLSGDEFVVVCPALLNEEEAVAIANRLSDALCRPVQVAGDEVLVSASIGVAFAQPGATSPEELLQDADAAMYRAKQRGRRRYEVFDSALRELAAQRVRVRGLLDRAHLEGRVVVLYQPIVDVATRRVVAMEALLRLRDDGGGLLEPAAFLAVAAESGLLPNLDEVLLRVAATQVAAWSLACGAPIGLAVNLCLGEPDTDLASAVVAALEEAGLQPGRLVVEVTEQALSDAGEAAELWLHDLHALGVRLALDDFGTGAASLSCLRRVPVSVLKVDSSFIAELPADPEGLVRAFLGLAGQLGLDAAAEGVETEEQFAALVTIGASYAQGHLFGRPRSAQETPAVLERLGVAPGGWPAGPLRPRRARAVDQARLPAAQPPPSASS